MANVYTGAEPYAFEHEGGGILRRVSWGALFAGLVVSLVTMLVFSLLGMGIGLGIINPATEETPFGGIGIGAAIWLGLTALISLFFGGWTTAKLAGSVRGLNGVLHSIVMWGLVTIASFFLMTTVIGSLIGGAVNIIGKGISAVGSGVSAVAPKAGEEIQQQLSQRGITVDSIMNQAKQLMGKSGGEAGGAGAGGGTGAEQDLRQTLQRIFSSGQQVSPQDREQLVNTLVTKSNMNRADAEKTVDGMIQQYQQVAQGAQQAKQQALQTTEQAMDAISKASLWIFVLMLLEAGAAALGGWLGSRREVVVHR
jgi:polyhydroxyalkanoate synthesis regulator phasin